MKAERVAGNTGNTINFFLKRISFVLSSQSVTLAFFYYL